MTRCRAKLLSAIFIVTVFLMPVIAEAADVTNPGFKVDVSQSMKERFSLCDEFLDVKWVDKTRLIGLLRADAYRSGKTEPRFLIVHLEKPGSKAFNVRGSGIFYEISGQDYSDAGYEKFLSGASYSFSRQNVFMNVSKGKRSERYPQEPLPFEAFINHRNEFPNRSFSGFTRTVCVAYPDNKKIFVIEAKKPFAKGALDEGSKQAYDTVAKHALERCADISTNETECSLNYLKDSYALNLNGDGRDDYIFVLSNGKGDKAKFRRYMMISADSGYSLININGCLGFERFFYGYSDGRGFHPGGCAR
jgi:hypothetical protein